MGVLVPEALAWITRKVRPWNDLPLEMHYHDDLGLGVANTIAGLLSGAQIALTTGGGLGQRAGNTSTEEIIMALSGGHGVPCSFNTKELIDFSKLVQDLTGRLKSAYSAIIGDNIFIGISQ